MKTGKNNPFARGKKSGTAPKAETPAPESTSPTCTEEPTMDPKNPAAPTPAPAAPAQQETPAAPVSAVMEQPKAPAAPAQPGENQNQPASFAQLKELFGTDSAMIVEAQSAGWSYTQAASEGLKKLRAVNAQLQAGQSRLGGAADAGVPAVGTAPGSAGAAAPTDYKAAVQAEMAQSNCKLHEAVDRVNKKHPELRAKSVGYDDKTFRPGNYRA